MPNLNADEIITQKHKRAFIQFGGARPSNPVRYAGQDAQYLSITGVSAPESGGIDPLWVHDPRSVGKYRLVGSSISPADLDGATLVMREKHGSLPWQLFRFGCQFNLYEPTGNCKDLSDFIAGWSDYVLVYSGALITDKDLGDRVTFDSDDAIEDSSTLVLADIYPVGSLAFGAEAANEVDREVADIVYAPTASCGACSKENDGTQWIYAVTKSSGAGSPGLPSELIYTVDGSLTWQQANITGIGASEDAIAVDIAGQYLIVIGASAYYYAIINPDTGVPGTFTKVTTGIVGVIYDLYVSNPREIFFVGAAGYIYKTTDITTGLTVIDAGSATTSNLYRIHGNENTLLAVGAGSATVKSVNKGITWATTTASVSGVPLDVLAALVLDTRRFWVGTGTSGRVYYTLDGGETWVQFTFSGAGAGNVYDIVAATGEVLYFSHSTATPTGRLFSSWNGGADWEMGASGEGSPRILSFPTLQKVNRIAVPTAANTGTAANNVALAGLSSGGVDGIILLGIAAKV